MKISFTKESILYIGAPSVYMCMYVCDCNSVGTLKRFSQNLKSERGLECKVWISKEWMLQEKCGYYSFMEFFSPPFLPYNFSIDGFSPMKLTASTSDISNDYNLRIRYWSIAFLSSIKKDNDFYSCRIFFCQILYL